MWFFSCFGYRSIIIDVPLTYLNYLNLSLRLPALKILVGKKTSNPTMSSFFQNGALAIQVQHKSTPKSRLNNTHFRFLAAMISSRLLDDDNIVEVPMRYYEIRFSLVHIE